jgi:hypothetical protein
MVNRLWGNVKKYIEQVPQETLRVSMLRILLFLAASEQLY